MRGFLRILAIAVLVSAWCPAIGLALTLAPITIDFSGTVSPGASPISNFELLYYGVDPSQGPFGWQATGYTSMSGTCAANSTCAVSASLTLNVPLGWSPFTSVYTIFGYYGGGPSGADIDFVDFPNPVVISNPDVFLVTNNSFPGSSDTFDNLYHASELAMSTHIYNGWTDPGSYTDAVEFFTYPTFPNPPQSSYFPSVTLGGSAAPGTIYDYSNGTANGSASIQASIVGATPEPATVGLLAAGLLLFGCRRLTSRS